MAGTFNIRDWLREMNLETYIDNFVGNGVEEWSIISTMTEEDLKNELQISKFGDRRKIMLEISRMVSDQTKTVLVHINDYHSEALECRSTTSVDNLMPRVLERLQIPLKYATGFRLYKRVGQNTATVLNSEEMVLVNYTPDVELWLRNVDGTEVSGEDSESNDIEQAILNSLASYEGELRVQQNILGNEQQNTSLTSEGPNLPIRKEIQRRPTGEIKVNDEIKPRPGSSTSGVGTHFAMNFKRTPTYTPEAFKGTQFVHQNFQQTEFVGSQYKPSTLTTQSTTPEQHFKHGGRRFGLVGPKKSGFNPAHVTAIDSLGNRYDETGSTLAEAQGKVNQKYASLEQTRFKDHKNFQQQAKQQHQTQQQELLRHHNELEQVREQVHGQEQSDLKIQHDKNQIEKGKQYNREATYNALAGAAASGALFSLTNSVVSNSLAYSRGEKSATGAAVQVAKDTAQGGLVGGAMAAVPEIAKQLSSRDIGGLALSAGFFALEASVSIYKWMKGECTAKQCATTIAKSFTVKASGAAVAAIVATGAVYALSFTTPIGPLVWAVPIVASALGYSGGAAAAEYALNEAAKIIYAWMEGKTKLEVLKDAYAFLGVNSDDPNSVISRAYHQAALIHHPDRGGNAEMFTKLTFYMEVIRAHREGRRYFEDHVLLLGYQ